MNDPFEYQNEIQRKALEKKRKAREKSKQQREKRKVLGLGKPNTEYLARLKARADEKGLDFDLTSEWMDEKFSLVFCEATGVKFQGHGRHPFGRTVDRKDNDKGYTIENCWVTCWMYNRCKSTHTHELVLEMARSMVNHSQ